MFDNLKALGELLALAQDDEKRGAMIAQIMTPVNQLAAAVAALAREQQQVVAQQKQLEAAMGVLLACASTDHPNLFTAAERAHYAKIIESIDKPETPPNGN